MLALRLCSLLLLWVWACPAQETDADDAAETFREQHIDYPPTTDLRMDQYCNQMMKERGLTDRKSNTFIRAPYRTIQAACNSNGEEQTGLRFTGKRVRAITCAAKKRHPDGSYGDYYMKSLLPNPPVSCNNGRPDGLYELVEGFYGLDRRENRVRGDS